ncbi:hypothetical protein [Hyalangium versicolor]|uniref:hypothetical protein n=1 Tax=Hyalangium versicolor TaxID=2861190 RepID=UPI001CCCD59A|nr:hypothetical protein [Hyalangium versicolor]
MSAISSRPSLSSLWRRAWSLSPALAVGTVVMILGSVLSAMGMVLDPRQLLGESVWLKPAKFYVSLAIYDVTILYLLGFLSERRRFSRAVGAVLSACGVIEMVAITLQAARGVRSHFNIATSFDQAIFSTMGITITVLWVTMVVLAVALLRAKLTDLSLASALRMGLLVGVVGAGLGFFMTSPNSEQIASMKAGEAPKESGSHTIGGKDGGPGLPLVGWSSAAGDMRPAHFLGLHGMQVLPVIAMLLARRRERSESRRLALVRASGVAYLGLTLAVAVQALRGLPIIHWDAIGVASLSLVLLFSLATFAASLLLKREPAVVAA